VRSRGVPTRPQRRDHRTRRPATARERPLQSPRPPAPVPALWSLDLSGPAVASDPAGGGESRWGVAAGSACDLCTAFLDEVAPGLAR
jgi:hypothetical protein